MQFTLLNTPALRAELNFLRGAMEAKASMPALQNFAFDFLDNNLVKILSTDLDCSASTIVECKEIKDRTSGLINAKKLLDILPDLPNNAECCFKQDENGWIELKSGKMSKYKIAGQAREDFPSIEKFDLSQPIELPALKFSQLINNTQSAITLEESQRFALNGAQLRIENEQVTMIATDGHRLALSSFPFAQNSTSQTIQLLIPKKALNQIKTMIDSTQGERIPDFFFSHSTNQICFEFGTKTLYSRTLSGQFPNYNLVLPQKDSITISLNIPLVELRQAVKRVAKMSDGKTQGIKLFFSDNLLTLLAQDSSVGKGEELVEIENPHTFDIGMNSNYLMDFLNKLTCNNITVKFKDKTSQCLLEPEKSEVVYKYVIMPLRI